MGCDGGTIPRRDELVRLKKKPEQKDKDADLAAKWQHCQITQEKLRSPIVACELGRLYNKESVLELLLDRSKFECAANFEHIRGLKDVKALNLTENPAYDKPDNEKGDAYKDMQAAQYICPVVGLEMNGRYKFCFLWKCGCVFSDRAMKEVKTEVCHKCGKPFKKEDIVILNPAEEDVEKNGQLMEDRRLQAKLEKKAKKAEKHKAGESTGSAEADGASVSKISKVEKTVGSKLANGTADKKLKVTNGIAVKSSKLANGKPAGDQVKPKSIQDDPSASKAFKSLFTTSEKAKNQPKGHWVTFNPQYN